MNNDFKVAGWKQDVFSQSSTRLHIVGEPRFYKGAMYRYGRAGASNLSAGKLAVSADCAAAHVNLAAVAAAVGDRQLTLTVTAGTAILADELKGGQLQINDAAGEGQYYEIASNTAITTTGISIVISLDEPINTALTTSSEFSLIHSPYNDVIESTTVTQPVGIPRIVVTAAYYAWFQTTGLGIVLVQETTGTGNAYEQSADIAGAVNTIDTDATEGKVGWCHGTAGVATEYKPIWLTIG